MADAERIAVKDSFRYFDRLDIGLIIADAECRVHFMNAWVRNRLERRHQEIRRLDLLFAGHDMSRFRRCLEQVFRTRSPQVISQAFHSWLIPLPDRRFSDGLMRQSCTISYLGDGLAEKPLAMIQIRDESDALIRIRQLKQARQRLADQAEDLASMNRTLQERVEQLTAAQAENQRLTDQLVHTQKMESLGTMAGGFAHHFNNILGVILGNAELALEDTDSGGLKDELKEIRDACSRAALLIKQILLFTHRREGEERETVNLEWFVKSHISMLRSILPRDTRLVCRVSDAPIYVHVNPDQIQQLLVNLVSNAVQAMGTDGELRIHAAAADLTAPLQCRHGPLPPGRYAMLALSDSGPGIPADILPRIFDPYFTTRKHQLATGMGLSIAYGIVKSHQGGIDVESRPGRGTTMRVYLPLA